MVDRQTLRSRGFGFIRFANGRHGAAAAQACVCIQRFGTVWVVVALLLLLFVVVVVVGGGGGGLSAFSQQQGNF